MSEKPASTDDVFYMVLITFLLAIVFGFLDSCSARMRYHDLRDRLERIEQRQR